MGVNIELKRSAVPNKVPLVTDLQLGELAINTYDGKVYLKKNVSGVESIITLASGNVSGSADTASYAIYAANAGTADTATNAPNYTLLSVFNAFTASFNTGSFSGSFDGTASYALNSLNGGSGGAVSASEGIYITSSIVMLGSDTVPSAPPFSTDRFINSNGSSLYFLDGNNVGNINGGEIAFSYINDSSDPSSINYQTFFGNQGLLFVSNSLENGIIYNPFTNNALFGDPGVSLSNDDGTNLFQFFGNTKINGDLTVTGSIFGTSSYAITASYWSGSIESASYAISASYTDIAGLALTASYIDITNGFLFTQSSATTTWSIDHELGSDLLLIDVYDSDYNMVIPTNIMAVDNNNTQILFSIATTGYAVLSKGNGTPGSGGGGTGSLTASYTDGLTFGGSSFMSSSFFSVNSGNTIISMIETGSFYAAFCQYLIIRGSNRRAGNFNATWDDQGNIGYSETSTVDVGLITQADLSADIEDYQLKIHISTDDSYSGNLLITYLAMPVPL